MFRSVLLLTAFLLLLSTAEAAPRVVLLAPAAADLFVRLDAGDAVVGVTRHVEDFPHAMKVGSYIKPNPELLAAARPELIVYSNARFFSAELASRLQVRTYEYSPETLEGVLTALRELGGILGKQEKAEQLIAELSAKRAQVVPLPKRKKVVYEIMQMPYTVAGAGSFAADIIRTAGGELPPFGESNHVRIGAESVLQAMPDVYLFQQGPMNSNPTPPKERPELAILNGCSEKVDQYDFTRPNTRSFDVVLALNAYLKQDTCGTLRTTR